MNGEVIKQFLVAIGFTADDKGLDTFVKKVDSSLKKVAVFGAAVEAAAAGIFYGTAKIAEGMADVERAGRRLNVPAEALNKMGYIAEQTGSSFDAVKSSLEGLQKNIGAVSLGSGPKEAFYRLGLNVRGANGHLKTASEMMDQIGKRIKGLDRARQVDLLEKIGIDPSLLPMMTSDISGLASEFEQMQKASGIDFAQAGADAIDFDNAIKRTKTTFDLFLKGLAANFFPKFRDSVERFRKAFIANMPQILATIKPLITAVMGIAEGISILFLRIFSLAAKGISWLGAISKATKGWSTAVIALGAAWGIFNFAIKNSPLGKLILLGTLIAALIDDFMGFQEGKKSLINWGNTWVKVLMGVAGGIGSVITYMYTLKAITKGVELATKAWGVATAVVNGIMKTVRAFVVVWQLLSTEIGLASKVMAIFDIIASANPIGLIIAGVAAFAGLAALVWAKWEPIKKFFVNFFDWFGEKWQWVTSLFGGGGNAEMNINATASPALVPGPQSASNQNNVNQKTEIVVQGSADPETTARSIYKEQGRVNADMVRNLKARAM